MSARGESPVCFGSGTHAIDGAFPRGGPWFPEGSVARRRALAPPPGAADGKPGGRCPWLAFAACVPQSVMDMEGKPFDMRPEVVMVLDGPRGHIVADVLL